MTLRPCTGCHRHARATETRCPFCGHALTLDTPSQSAPGRLGRAALFAFRTTAAAAALTGCGPTAQPPPPETIAQPYGAPPNPEFVPPPTTVAPPPATVAPPETTTPPPSSAAPTHHHHATTTITPTTEPSGLELQLGGGTGDSIDLHGGGAQGYGGAPFEQGPLGTGSGGGL